jgi:hypothetical protein
VRRHKLCRCQASHLKMPPSRGFQRSFSQLPTRRSLVALIAELDMPPRINRPLTRSSSAHLTSMPDEILWEVSRLASLPDPLAQHMQRLTLVLFHNILISMPCYRSAFELIISKTLPTSVDACTVRSNSMLRGLCCCSELEDTLTFLPSHSQQSSQRATLFVHSTSSRSMADRLRCFMPSLDLRSLTPCFAR